ncbi:MAG: PASTA domain-containing protein [Chloroflexia bacterium]
MTLDEARAEGDRVGVQLTTSSDPASDEPEGTILSQDPGANAEVERGSTVALVVAGASEGAALPTGAPTEDAQTSPSPGATPTANLDPRENVAQLLAVGGPVRVQTIVDGDTRTYSLAEGGYLEVRGGRLRIRADQADRLAITLNGVSRGTLLELANQWADKSVPGPSAFIQTQSRPGVSNGDNNDD